MHQGNGFILAETGGVEDVTLNDSQQVPAHGHPLLASTGPGSINIPTGNVTAEFAAVKIYIQDTPSASMNPVAVTPVGASQPHTNFQPYLCINFIISLFGIFPSPT